MNKDNFTLMYLQCLTSSMQHVCERPSVSFAAHVKQLSYNRMTGETVLHKAARLGYDDVIIIKIREGADVNARDHAGWTPLHEACSRGMTHVVRALLKYGADPNCCSENGIRYAVLLHSLHLLLHCLNSFFLIS